MTGAERAAGGRRHSVLIIPLVLRLSELDNRDGLAGRRIEKIGGGFPVVGEPVGGRKPVQGPRGGVST